MGFISALVSQVPLHKIRMKLFMSYGLRVQFLGLVNTSTTGSPLSDVDKALHELWAFLSSYLDS
jgi:hypothetical protein